MIERSVDVPARPGISDMIRAVLVFAGGILLRVTQLALRIPAPYRHEQLGLAHIAAARTWNSFGEGGGQDGGLEPRKLMVNQVRLHTLINHYL